MKTSISNDIYQNRVVAVFTVARDFCRICRFISLSVAKTIATTLVNNNSLLYNTANKHITKLQHVQICLAIHVKFWKCQCGRFIRKSEGLGENGILYVNRRVLENWAIIRKLGF